MPLGLLEELNTLSGAKGQSAKCFLHWILQDEDFGGHAQPQDDSAPFNMNSRGGEPSRYTAARTSAFRTPASGMCLASRLPIQCAAPLSMISLLSTVITPNQVLIVANYRWYVIV